MTSMRAIRKRREGIQNTEEIARAMKLAATARLKGARERAEAFRPFAGQMEELFAFVFRGAEAGGMNLQPRPSSGKRAVLAVTSDRGLAGGYSQNVVRLIAESGLTPENTVVYTAGRKGRESLEKKGYLIKGDFSWKDSAGAQKRAEEIAQVLMEEFSWESGDELYLAYTVFVNPVRQVPRLLRLFALDSEEKQWGDQGAGVMEITLEPEEEELLRALKAGYAAAMIWTAFLEAEASENGARMTAMEGAKEHAEEMLKEMNLAYNRLRQGAITRELTEIMAGSGGIF